MDHPLCWFPENGPQVECSRKGYGRVFQSVGQASAGRALPFLLAHGGAPLVLDQPEDDLDNHLIYGLVVLQIRTNEQRRQLLIVTHNALVEMTRSSVKRGIAKRAHGHQWLLAENEGKPLVVGVVGT
ncbi:UNVERIFIED_ORG: hypothetical protein J2Y76_005199 [Pseudomonas reinekei]|nr:hypothetical protein [Pseudomonas reinekei]